MASSKKGKKVVNQEELRRLMREKQRQVTEKRRVESPFAKYNSLGHLSCVLCNVQVKSELLWSAHILGKQHKEKVVELKESRSAPQPQPQPVKRKAPSHEDSNGKRSKPTTGPGAPSVPGLPEGFFEKPSESDPGGSHRPAVPTLLGGAYDDDDDDDDSDKEEKGNDSAKSAPAGLPADFFDSAIPSAPAVSHSGSVQKAEEPEKPAEKPKMAEALPEGFFDDPVTDAKVRNVDAPKDHMDKEWEEFQKEMRLVNTKSDAIVAEDDEEGRLERQIDEIDEQIEYYKRVELVRDKRDIVKSKSKLSKRKSQEQVSDATMMEEDSEGEDEEEELLDLLSRDWRAKGALA